MMIITFQREGFAHNSSSSHSLIFLKDSTYINLQKRAYIGTDEYREFGWEQFTVGDKKGKLNYFLICLFTYFKSSFDYDDPEDDTKYDKQSKKDFDVFYKFLVDNEIFSLYAEQKPTKKELKETLSLGYVDHESFCSFPYYRDKSRGINVEFIKAFFKELLKPNYIILGGCDSTDDNHWLMSKSSKKPIDFLILYERLRNSYDTTYCEYDDLLQSFILSFADGTLFIIKFV